MHRRAFLPLTLLAVFIGSASGAIAQADEWPGEIEHHFRLLRERIHQEGGPNEIIALLSAGSQCVIEVKAETAFLRCHDGIGRTRERDLKAGELAKLKAWIAANKVDDLPPFDEGVFDGMRYEYVHLDRSDTEHRVPMNNPPGFLSGPAAVSGDSTPAPQRELYGELTKRLSDLASVPMPVRYKPLEHLPGFEVIHGYEKGFAKAFLFRHGQLLVSFIYDDDPT